MALGKSKSSQNFDSLFPPGKWVCKKCGAETDQPRHVSLAAKDGKYRCDCGGALEKK